MRQIVFLLSLLMLIGMPAFADKADELSKEYHRLCQIKGHFQGGPDWVSSVDSWGGEKHNVMRQLGELLGKPGTEVKRVTALLGEPQQNSGGPSSQPVALRANERLLCYYWRGGHDFLYFVVSADCEHPVVHKSGWWLALE
jgi:hypothetical protein